MKRWFVVQTKFSQEETAVTNLKRQRFVVFFPTIERKQKRGKKEVSIVRPLFTSYLFIRFDPDRNTRWRKILSTRGVQRILGCDETHLTPVRDAAMQLLFDQCHKNGLVKQEDHFHASIRQFCEGDSVVIRSGALSGHPATICNIKENTAEILFTLLGRTNRLSLPVDRLSLSEL